jgi:transcriptional regulator with XRE-family HTH domain
MALVELGERIASLREERALTQVQLAEKARISPSTLSQIESGRVPRPHVGTIRKIARALSVEPQELRSAEEPALAGKAEASGTRRSKIRGRKISTPSINIPRIGSTASREPKPETYYEQEEEIASFPYTEETRVNAFKDAQRVAAEARPHYDAVVSGDARFVVEDDGERVAVYLEVPMVDADTTLGILRGGTDNPAAGRASEQSQEVPAPTKNDDS